MTGCMDRYVAYTGWAATLCDLQRLGKFVSYIDWQAAGLSLTCTHRSFLGQSLFADVVHKIKTGLQRTFSLCRPVFAYNLLFFDLHGCILASAGSGDTLFLSQTRNQFLFGSHGLVFHSQTREQPFFLPTRIITRSRRLERRFSSLRPAGTLHKTIFLLNIRSDGLFSRP